MCFSVKVDILLKLTSNLTVLASQCTLATTRTLIKRCILQNKRSTLCFAVNIYLGKQMYFCNTPLVAVNINEGLRHSNLDRGCLIKQRQAHYISFYF